MICEQTPSNTTPTTSLCMPSQKILIHCQEGPLCTIEVHLPEKSIYSSTTVEMVPPPGKLHRVTRSGIESCSESVASFSVLNPVSYTIRRSNNGLVWGAPTLVETSGNEAFDQSVARWLRRPEVLSQLPIGYLSVRVFFW